MISKTRIHELYQTPGIHETKMIFLSKSKGKNVYKIIEKNWWMKVNDSR